MPFLAPWFLVGALAAVIPLLLHLRRSRRMQKIVFSTTRFFDEQFIRASRRARLQDLLVMMLRILLLILLVLAMMQPVLRHGAMAQMMGLDGRRHVAIVLDDSASMGVMSERGVLFERARRGALALLDELSAERGDTATVVLAGYREAGPRVLFSRPTSDIAAVREVIEQLELTDLATDIDGAVRSAAAVLGTEVDHDGRVVRTSASGGRREIFIFSDMQTDGFLADARLGAGPLISSFFVATRPQSPPPQGHLSIDAVQYDSPQTMVGMPFALRAIVTNHGPSPRQVLAQLVIGEDVTATSRVEVPAGRSTAVRFRPRISEPGWFAGHVEIEPADDGPGAAFAAAQRRYFAIEAGERMRLLAVNGAPSSVPRRDELFFFRTALTLDPAALARPGRDGPPPARVRIDFDEIRPDALRYDRLRGYPMVVMANVRALNDDQLADLERYVDGGGRLLITLGDRVDPAAYKRWIGPGRLHDGLLPARLTRSRQVGDEDDAAAVAHVEEGHYIFADPAEVGLAHFGHARIGRRFDVEAVRGDVLMSAGDDMPLLLERRFGRGRVMMLTTGIDRDWNDLPVQPVYVSWLYRMIGHLGQAMDAADQFLATGRAVSLPASVTAFEPMRIRMPDGSDTWPEGSATAFNFDATERAGIYKVYDTAARGDARPRMLLAANMPHAEARLAYAEREHLETFLAEDAAWMMVDEPEAVAQAGRLARQGIGLWDPLLMLALAVVVAEPWIANRLSRRRQLQAQSRRAAGGGQGAAAPGRVDIEQPAGLKRSA